MNIFYEKVIKPAIRHHDQVIALIGYDFTHTNALYDY
jgi:hypothetical protein